MFRVDFYVDDKKLGAALLALVGIAHGQPGVVPVVNAKTNGHKVVAISDGSSMDKFAAILKKHKGQTLVARDVAPLVKLMGMSPMSRGYLMNQAAKAGLVKKTGKGSGTKYTVV